MHSRAVTSCDVQPIKCSECGHINTFCLPMIQLKQVLTDQTEELRSTRVEGLRKVREGLGRKERGNQGEGRSDAEN